MDVYPIGHLKTVIDSEWDISQALHGLIQQINEQPKLEQLSSYSYQGDDLTINTTTLPIGAQFNIEADKLVTKGLQYLHPKLMYLWTHWTHLQKCHYITMDKQYPEI